MKKFSGIVTIAASALSLILLVTLHFLEPQFDPNWHFVSEYALGPWGWILSSVFLLVALGCWAIVPFAWSWLPRWGGRLGLAFIVLGGLAIAVAAFNSIDPILDGPTKLTTHGNIHGLMSIIGNPALSLGMLITSLALARQLPAGSRAMVRIIGFLPWVSLLAMFAIIGLTLPAAGIFGPQVPLGWPNRLVFMVYELWLVVIALSLVKQNWQPIVAKKSKFTKQES